MTNNALMKLTIDEMFALRDQICAMLEQKLQDEMSKLQARLNQLRVEPGRKLDRVPPQRRFYPPVAPKFQNPMNPSITWSGRGKRPRWIIDLIASGKAIEEFRI